MTTILRHPVIARASSTFITCGLADSASQLFLDSSLDPDRSVRFALSGSLSVIPVWFGWNALIAESHVAKRILLEAFLFGPLYLASMLWWNSVLTPPHRCFSTVKTNFIPLYWDALRVVPTYNALVWFAVAPSMRGYALTGCQFVWNTYLAWFVHNAVIS